MSPAEDAGFYALALWFGWLGFGLATLSPNGLPTMIGVTLLGIVVIAYKIGRISRN